MKQPKHTKSAQVAQAQQRRATIAVMALFALACPGRLIAPEVVLFRELLPIAATLLGLWSKKRLVGKQARMIWSLLEQHYASLV